MHQSKIPQDTKDTLKKASTMYPSILVFFNELQSKELELLITATPENVSYQQGRVRMLKEIIELMAS